MAPSAKNSSRSVKAPTLQDWIAAKERGHAKEARLPFIKKIRIIEAMNRPENRLLLSMGEKSDVRKKGGSHH